MLIIAGHLIVDPAEREAAMAVNTQVVALARKAPGCLDFAITADTLDPARIDVYERWESEEQLLAFRGSGLDGDDAARILDADVKRYTISAVGEP
ncbi:MAG: antibiotic biosynthesis monooxygenase [Pseudonocardia sp. SCN 72-86]|nr:MAG: antibiotic biosynthesis monooxygenase [Pseudonocardia sp. SCN 72-86]